MTKAKAPDYSKVNTQKLKEMRDKTLQRDAELQKAQRENDRKFRHIDTELLRRVK